MLETFMKTSLPTYVHSVIKSSSPKTHQPIINHCTIKIHNGAACTIECELNVKKKKIKITSTFGIFFLLDLNLDYRSVSCPVCWKEFKDAGTLKIHIRDIHTDNEQKFTCHICDKQYKSINTLRNHRSLYHKGEK